MRYNIPPQFNFLKYNNPDGRFIRPFAMYIFDFSVLLPKEDIAKIWQNVTPDIGLDTYGSRNGSRSVISSQIVEHDLFDLNDLLDPSAEVVTEQIQALLALQLDIELKTGEADYQKTLNGWCLR